MPCMCCFLPEQEVTELRNKVNKLEDENKRLSQLIRENKVTLPSTWSDASVITTTMRATSSLRNPNTQTSSAAGNVVKETTQVPRVSDVTPIPGTTSVTNRLSVTSILSSACNQQTTSNSRQRIYERVATTGSTAGSINKSAIISTQSSTTPRGTTYVAATLPLQTSSSSSVSRGSNIHRRHNVTGVAVATGSGLSQTVRSSHVSTPSNDVTKVTFTNRAPSVNTVGQPMFVSQPQTAVAPSGATTNAVVQLSEQTAPTSNSFERFTQVPQLRSNSVQDNISQLPYSIDALTGNQASHNRQQNSGTGQLLSFSAESLIGRQQPSNDVVMINSPANQPVIQNTFTLTHRNSPTNANVKSSSAPAQSFSNFSALSLVGSNDAFSVSASSTTQTLTRSTTAVPDSATIQQSNNQMFTDFSTESLIGPSEFTSDFAIDNLISRSDSSVHMATINPNLIQSFGKGNDPMISSVSGDHSNHSLHNLDPPGLNIGVFSSSHLFPTYWYD